MADLQGAGVALASLRLQRAQSHELHDKLQASAYGVRLIDAENSTVAVCLPLPVYQLLFQLASTVSDPTAMVKLFDLTGAEDAAQDGDVSIGDVFKR